jgi:hypothetical protein
VTVAKQTPVVAVAPAPTAITYGQTLADSTLSGGTATNAAGAAVAGSFAFTTPTNAPDAGSTNVTVLFTPTDLANYNLATATITVSVNKQVPVVATVPTATAILYGQTLADSTLSGGAVTNAAGEAVDGGFVFATPTIAPNAGSTNVSVIFTPADTTNYDSVATLVTVAVQQQGTAVATLPVASAIVYGQTLSDSVLSGGTVTNGAGATVVGSFAFATPTNGPDAGSTNVSVTFTPADAVNYNSASMIVAVAVDKATPALDAPVAGTITHGLTLAASTLTGGSATNVNNHAVVAGSFAYVTPDLVPGIGTTIVNVLFTPADTANYNSASTTVAVTVNGVASTLVVASSSNPSGYKDSVSFTASLPTDATGSVIFLAGSVPFSTNEIVSGSAVSGAAPWLLRGTNVITAQYAGDGNYLGSTNSLAGGQIVTNHPPVAGNLTYTRSVTTFKMAISALLTNVTDIDGDTITLTGFSTSTNGVAIVTNATLFQYSNTNYVNDQFTYTVTDGYGGSSTGTVSVVSNPFVSGQGGTVTPVNGAAQLKFYGIPDYRYGIQRTTNMVDWTLIWTTNAPASGVIQYTDTFSDLGAPPASAFYRLIWNP